MGKPCFSRIVKFFAIALLGVAAAIAVIAVLSSPAASSGHDGHTGGGNRPDLKNWDSDNLRFGSYTSASFRVPSHDYGRLADRTLAVASGRTAWDLDVTSPHPLTASAPRDATAGSGDPDGCADGSKSRADHASSR